MNGADPREAANRDQARASDPETSVWVSAHAGSGKTHVLVNRVIRLLLAGVPPERILVEMASEDTHAQAQHIQPLLASQGVDEFVLVTSGWHLRRSMGAFLQAGMTPIPSAAGGRSLGAEEAGLSFLPSEAALARSRSLTRELIALQYYRLRGWM